MWWGEVSWGGYYYGILIYMLVSYISLEPNSLSSLGIASPSFSGASPTFLATSTFIYMLLIALAVEIGRAHV